MKSIKACIAFNILFWLALILFAMCAVVTRPNEYVLIRQFGAVRQVISEPGLSFKIPFIQSVETVPKYKMCYDLAPSTVNTSF